jgi:hypothetical protein
MTHSAILYVLTGDPTTEELPSEYDRYPAADLEATDYLDGRRIHHGTIAGYTMEQERVPLLGEDFITDEIEERQSEVLADTYIDVEAGWGGISTGAAEEVFVDYLGVNADLTPEPAHIDLVAFGEDLPEDAEVRGIVYSQSQEEGHSRDAAGAHWHEDADRSRLPGEGFSALAVKYVWEGSYIEAMIAASGYVAVYKKMPAEVYARFVADEIEPYLEQDRDEQEEFLEELDL